MSLMQFARSLFGRGGQRQRKSFRFRPEVEALEGRWLPSTITEFPLPPLNNGAGFTPGITNGPDGNLWFTHDRTLATITPTGVLRDHVADNVGNALTTGPDGNLWASGPQYDPLTGRLAGDFIQRISVTGSVTTFSVGTF